MKVERLDMDGFYQYGDQVFTYENPGDYEGELLDRTIDRISKKYVVSPARVLYYFEELVNEERRADKAREVPRSASDYLNAILEKLGAEK